MWIAERRREGLRVALDLETFDATYLRALLPIAARENLGFVRAKFGNFYGGNRFRESSFASELAAFREGLRSVVPDLARHGVRLLLENHQDLGSRDLCALIREISPEWLGINWDIGNSWAVHDTPETFLARAERSIGNLHLKDYRLFRDASGFRLSRCALGEGVADLRKILPAVRAVVGPVPMAIELGAQVSRLAEVDRAEWWRAYPEVSDSERMSFLAAVESRLETGDGWRSAWEEGRPGLEIQARERKEMEASVEYLSSL